MKTTLISPATLILKFMLLILFLGILISCSPAARSPTTPITHDADGPLGIKNASGEETTLSGTPITSVLDSGFDPGVHGFSFENYTNRDEVVNLTAQDMQRLFGDPVCARLVDGDCTLSPTARDWMERANRAMNGGHCEGIAVLSQLMFYDRIDPEKFGDDVAYDLVLEGNVPLQREIAYWWMTQITSPGSSIRVNSAPSEVVKTLQEALSQGEDIEEAWVMGIYQPDMSAGHSITPAALEDQGEGIYHIMVYDNNFPSELRPVVVDTNQETWQYQSRSRPDDPDSIYRGDADTKTLEVVAISPRLEQQDCFFCRANEQKGQTPKASVDAEGNIFNIWLEGDADLLITDKAGRRLGYADGEFVNEIPGAQVRWLRTQAESGGVELTPHYLVPFELGLDFLIDGGRLESPGYSSFSLIGSGGGFVAIDNIWVRPGETQEVSVWADGANRYQVIFWPNDIETPIVKIGVESERPQADYTFMVRANELTTSEDELNVIVDGETGEFTLSTAYNAAPVSYGLYVQRIDQDSEFTFARPEFSLDPNTTVTLVYDEWEGDGEVMRAFVDYGNDGQIDKELELPDQQIDFDFYE